jgi:hypothetical protein
VEDKKGQQNGDGEKVGEVDDEGNKSTFLLCVLSHVLLRGMKLR